MPIVTGYIGPIRFADLRRPRRVADLDGWRVPRMTATDLVGFVAGVVEGKIFLGHQVQPIEDIGCVFPGLELLRNVPLDARREIGTVYEYRDQAAGTARNGQPMFTSVRYVHREDWAQARDMIAAETIRRGRQPT